MDYGKAFAISAAGMAVERTRVEVAAQNLANASTVQGGDGGYEPQRVVATSTGRASIAFPEQVDRMLEGVGLADVVIPEAVVEPTGRPPRLVHDPGHPLADVRGFVSYPGVDPATEMVTLMSAVRAYEGNVAAMNTAKALALKALEIGGGA